MDNFQQVRLLLHCFVALVVEVEKYFEFVMYLNFQLHLLQDLNSVVWIEINFENLTVFLILKLFKVKLTL